MAISLEEFFTTSNPAIDTSTIILRIRLSLKKIEPVLFMEKYKIKISKGGAAVFDGEKAIASMGKLSDIFVDKDYRGQNIAANMICEWFVANNTYRPSEMAYRSEIGQKSYTKAFEMIKIRLPDLKD